MPVVFLASNTNGGIKKKFYAKKSAAPVAQACVDKHPGNAMKQCSSLANTERQRNSRGDNNNMHNSISMLSLASYKRGAGTFFSQSSDPEGKLSRIQNVLAKFPNKTTGLATKASNLVSIVNTPVYNAFVPENVLKLADYGNNNANKFNYMINGFLRVGAVVVYGHSQVNADNAHLMEVFILHDYLTSGNHNLCKTLLQASNNRINVQRFDCHGCDNVVVPGCGDKYCEDCKPEVSHIQFTLVSINHLLIISFLYYYTSHSTAPFPMRTGRETDMTTCQILASLESKANLEMYGTRRRKTGKDVHLKYIRDLVDISSVQDVCLNELVARRRTQRHHSLRDV